MKKILSILFLLLIPFPKIAHAASTVNITTQNNSNSQTDVTINTNGNINSFHTDGNQNVDWESPDGTSKVTIHNTTNSSTDNIHPTILPARTTTVTLTPTATASPTQRPSQSEKSDLHPSFLTRILQHFQFLKKLFPWI